MYVAIKYIYGLHSEWTNFISQWNKNNIDRLSPLKLAAN